MKKVLGILFIALILIFSGSTFAQSNDSNLATSSETTAVSSGSAVENDYLGNLNSNITITEFGGFDEPFSRRFYETTYQELKKKYIDTGKVMFSFNTFPLSFYPNDIESAKASYCARQQNNFWKYFSKLFENKNLEKNKLIDYASELGMNKEKFSNCLDSADAKQFVDNAINYANNNKINGSPTFFIQKEESYIMETPAPPMEIIQGAQSINAFEDILQKFGVKIENIVGTTSAQVNNNAVATETTTTVETVEEIRPLEPFDTTYNEKVLSISGVEKSPLDEYNMPITYNLWNSNPSLGEPNSKIEIVVFGDLQDPFTRQFFNNTFPTIQKYIDQGKVEFVWKDFPLSFHENAFEMAVAGRCAKNYSNKYFWNYQNALFALMNSKLERIPSISTTDLQNIAEEIGIGGTDFNDCLKKQAVKIVLDQDASDAKKATVNATPTFFINQYKVEGTLNTADFEKIITTILEETEGSAIRIPGEGNAKIEIPGKTEPIPADKIKIPSRPAPNLPDLFLTKIQFRAEKSLEGKELDEFKVNTPVYLYTTIESIGQQKISSSFGLSIYVDGELFLTQSLNQEQLDALNSGKPVTVNETFVSFSTNGNHEIKAVVDSFENINEANENNNDIIRKINVLGENEDTNNQCSGCSESNSCIPLGTRVVDNSNKAQYCDLSKTVKDQKETGSSCQNNFECLSNSCSNSVCVDVKGLANQQQETNQLLKQLIDLLQSIFRALGLKG